MNYAIHTRNSQWKFHYYILVTDLEILLFVCGVTKMTALIRQGTYMYGYLSCLCVDAVIVIYTH